MKLKPCPRCDHEKTFHVLPDHTMWAHFMCCNCGETGNLGDMSGKKWNSADNTKRKKYGTQKEKSMGHKKKNLSKSNTK